MRPQLAAQMLWLVVAGTALAGPELDHAQLLENSDAIALIEHRDNAWQMLRWLRRPKESHVEWVIHPPCLADTAQLNRWLAGISRHPSRRYWQAALDASSHKQIIYFRQREEALQAWCETEVLLAEDWSVHPAYQARKAAAIVESARTCNRAIER